MGDDGEAAEVPPIERHPDGVVAIDTLTGGMTRVTAGYLITAPRPALIECGPALSIDRVIAGLHEVGLDASDLAYLIVTHIHLDHAGGAGDVAAAFPSATIVASELGAPHLHDPEKLNRSSRLVYGELLDQVYGECTPIDTERIRGIGEGHRIDLGDGHVLDLMYTPGHAKHHIGILDNATGSLFTGDSVGVMLPGMTALRPATPPPDFHLEAALRSLARYRERRPERVYLAHYGAVDPPDEALANAAERLQLWADTADEAYSRSHELDHVIETLAERFAGDVDPSQLDDDPDAQRRLDLLSGYASNAAGLVRYFKRRDEGTLTPVG